ncbi:hypothetical protein EASAB2608_06583 [Streptomyces sp. EAS-AB2608]|uniref:hypothetical protein n=1 Tax=Streptomyces sp. EAS-AB2608 TaxID=2779671 RepID=UPI001BEFC835|nr:hypothetical protein [Streptomyces sp. EAS-AB2608]BCM71249.1 hypothetical protein EASAB2608_06583 [Streptomyces sp. EAS-AB2608]
MLPTQNTTLLADEITRRLAQLSRALDQLPADQALKVIAHILNPDDGVLGRFTQLVEAGSRFAKDQAERGALPAEVWLALGRAANELYGIGCDLDDHKDTLVQLGTRAGPAPAKPVVPAPLVARRHR